MQFIPLENTAYVSEQVQYPQPLPQPEPLVPIPEVPVPEVPTEELVVHPVESIQQDVHIFVSVSSERLSLIGNTYEAFAFMTSISVIDTFFMLFQYTLLQVDS